MDEDKNINNAMAAVKSFAQMGFISNLEMKDDNFKYQFEIIPVTVKKSVHALPKIPGWI